MSKLPVVAIVGRPNVGKSTLFNRLVGKKLALVDDRPGVTRDRREGDASLIGLEFRIIDTAGYEDHDAQTLPGRMRQQTEAAVEQADVALFLFDARAGIVPLDEEIARWLRTADVPVILVANKSDDARKDLEAASLWTLGLGEPFPASALHGRNVADLLDMIMTKLPAVSTVAKEEIGGPRRVAILGRPNVGKSSLLNKAAGEERVVVDHLAPAERAEQNERQPGTPFAELLRERHAVHLRHVHVEDRGVERVALRDPGERLVQAVRDPVAVTLLDPAADPLLIDFHDYDRSFRHRRRERLSATHSAHASGQDPATAQRAAEMRTADRTERLIRALQDALRSDVDPRARGHLAVHR